MKTIRLFHQVRGSLWGGTLAVIIMFTLLVGSTSAQVSSLPTPETGASPTLLPAIAPPDQLQSPASPAFPQDTPEIMVNELASEWTVGGGFIYWTYDCSTPVEFRWDGYLRRKPAHGTPTTISSTLQNLPWTDCVYYDWLTADNDGLYYYNYNPYDTGSQGIKMRAANTPTIERGVYTTTTQPDQSIGLATDSTYVYWIAGTQLRRAPKNGSTTGAGIVAETNSGPTSLVVLTAAYWEGAYWLDSTGLWKVATNCTTLPCGSKINLSETSGKYLLYQVYGTSWNGYITFYWANGDKIQYYRCFWGSCSTGTFYTAPTTDWKIGKLGSDGSSPH